MPVLLQHDRRSANDVSAQQRWLLIMLTMLICSLVVTSTVPGQLNAPLQRLPAPNDTHSNDSDEESVPSLEGRLAALALELAQVRELLAVQQQQTELLKGFTDRMSLEVESQAKTVPGLELLEELRVGARQGAARDQQIQFEIDRLTEEMDVVRHDQARLPATLRESFLPTRFDQSPLVIYNTLQTGYADFQDADGRFVSSAWLPHFYLLLREKFQIQVNPLITRDRLQILSAQIDFFLADHLTVTAGRFYSPLGFFPERLHTSWVTKTPDTPLLFQQVYPFLLSFNGIQFRGARYIGHLPVKLEYSAIAANGISMDVANPTQFDFANFNPVRTTFGEVNKDKGYGGRIGLSFPKLGLIVGVSALGNGAYDRTGREDLTFVDIDASLHRGNWDLRFEYARVDQQTPFGPIDRQGFYFQTAYRNYQSVHPLWGKLEPVVRYDWVDFDGIDLAQTGLNFGSRERIPIGRHRYTCGLNYYFYPSLIWKLAYELNDEREFTNLKDDGFLTQLTLGF